MQLNSTIQDFVSSYQADLNDVYVRNESPSSRIISAVNRIAAACENVAIQMQNQVQEKLQEPSFELQKNVEEKPSVEDKELFLSKSKRKKRFENTPSRIIVKALRHRPESLGLQKVMDAKGFVPVSILLKNLKKYKNITLDESELQGIVDADNKGRLSLVDGLIRAVNGHSREVDIGQAMEPPKVLYHGTTLENIGVIHQSGGLSKMQRQYVNLTEDYELAVKSGKRHGKKAAILQVNALAMHRDQHQFFKSENGVWNVAAVPNKYIVLAVKN